VEATGFKAASVLSGSAALLFPVLVAQVNLRSKMVPAPSSYIEYVYFVLYTAILGVLRRTLSCLPPLAAGSRSTGTI